MTKQIESDAQFAAREQALQAHILKSGLQAGLSKFYGRPTRVAVIYSVETRKPDEFLVYDTLGVLDEHKQKFQTYFRSAVLRTNIDPNTFDYFTRNISDTLVCFEYQLSKFFYQLWCIEIPQ